MKFDNLKPGGSYSGPSRDDFIKLQDGDVIQGVFAGDPHIFHQHNRYPEKPILCTGTDCEACKAGDYPKARFRINLITKENGKLVAKCWEQSGFVYETLQELNKDYDLEKHTVKIKRTGNKQDTRYTILPLPEGKLSEEAIAKLKEIPLLELDHKPKTDDVEVAQGDSPPDWTTEEAPIEDVQPVFSNDDDIPF